MEQKTVFMEVTPDERELLEAVRNYNKSFPMDIRNCYGSLKSCSTIWFDSLTTKEQCLSPHMGRGLIK